VVVVTGDVGVEAGKAEALKQMGLAQIADIIIDAARLGPSRHRPDVAREHQKTENSTGNLQGSHFASITSRREDS
jgi:hypothetical protein